MASPDLIIFDCDGVLIDSEVLANEVFVRALESLGVCMTQEEALREYVGINRASAAAKIESRYKIKIPDNFWDTMRVSVFELFQGKLKPIQGVAELVDALPMKKCVASGSGPQTLKCALGLTGLWERFDPHVFSSHQVKNGKPAPDLFLFAAQRMNALPSCCLVIEDSVAGVRAAKAAAMRVFGFVGGSHCGAGHADILRREGAEQVFAKMSDIGEVLL